MADASAGAGEPGDRPGLTPGSGSAGRAGTPEDGRERRSPSTAETDDRDASSAAAKRAHGSANSQPGRSTAGHRGAVRSENVPWHGHQHHRDVAGGWLRPAVFGVMDGLVSNVALLSGFAGGSASRSTVVLAGLAGLASGAFSMATGEYTSVKSQNEATSAEIEVERRALSEYPVAERKELAAAYREKGVDPALADQVARALHLDPNVALAVHSQEELGVTPGRLPSALVAALASFAAFGLGALVPVLPYLFGADEFAISAALAAVALFVVGVLVSRFTGRSPLLSGARQLALGVLSAGATYLVGYLVGSGIG